MDLISELVDVIKGEEIDKKMKLYLAVNLIM